MLLLTHVERDSAKTGKKSDASSIAWTADGKAFVIRNEEEFTTSVLPLVFGRSKFSSFTRRLYRWGFRRIGTNAARGNDVLRKGKLFYHEHFQRDDKQLLSKIQGMTPDGTKSGNMNPPSTVSFPAHRPQTDRLSQAHSTFTIHHFSATQPAQHQPGMMSSLLLTPTERCAMTIMDALQLLPTPKAPNLNNPPVLRNAMTPQVAHARPLAPAAVHQFLEYINQPCSSGHSGSDQSLYPLLHSALAMKLQREQNQPLASGIPYTYPADFNAFANAGLLSFGRLSGPAYPSNEE